MTSRTLLTLLGADAANAAWKGTSLRWAWEPWPIWMVAFLLCAMTVGWWAYRQNAVKLPPSSRWLFVGLRAAFLTLLAVIFLQPELVLTMSRPIPRSLLMAIDRSESFGICDLGRKETRVETAARLLKDDRFSLLRRLRDNVNVSLYAFGDGVSPLDPDAIQRASIPAGDSATAIGQSVDEMLARHAGEPLAGVVLMTDGNVTRGPSLESIAERLRSRGVPLHIIGIGVERTTDAGIVNIQSPTSALVGDVLPVRIRVHSDGLDAEPGTVVLSLDGVAVARQAITFSEAKEQDVDLEFLPQREGLFQLQASVESSRRELLDTNNQATQLLRVADGRIRILLIEQAPRWEFKYLQAMLLRERRVELKCLLLEGDPNAARDPGSPYLPAFPRREELFGYDLVFLGDVAPKALTDVDWNSLKELVSDIGGALVVIAGKRFMPAEYRDSPVEAMLPIEATDTASAPHVTEPLQLLPTRQVPMLLLADDPQQNRQVWEQLPPIYWTAEGIRPKPAAEVLVRAQRKNVDSQAPSNGNSAGTPIAVLQRFGAGEVLFMATDNSWRWRRNQGDQIYTRFWGQVVQRMAGLRLVAGSSRSFIQTDRENYEPNARVEITATLRSRNWEPLRQEGVQAVCEAVAGSGLDEFAMRGIPGQPGEYRAEILAHSSGAYRVAVPEYPDVVPADFLVHESQREFESVTVDVERLRRVAERTGGSYFHEAEASDFPARIGKSTAEKRYTREVALWSSPLYFAFLLLPLTAEWILRKRSELK